MSDSLELLVTEGPNKGTRYKPTEAGLKLGRSSSCDIAITDPALSRNHCLFELRDDSVWVTDLASANGTEVNGEPVTEKELAVGDRVMVGDSVLEVVKEGEEARPSAVSAPVDESKPIDLGFSRDKSADSASAAKGSNMFRAVLWGVCAVVVLGAVSYVLLNPLGSETKDKPLEVDGERRERIVSLSYEKVEASTNGIFRYAMQVGNVKDEQGMKTILTVTVDDALTDNRHVEKSAELSKEKLDKLAQDVFVTGVMKLDSEYTGIAAKPNTLKSSRLKIVTTDKVFETSAENTTLPGEFANVSAKLEAFSSNELGIWAIQYSTDKLKEMAQASMERGRAKWADRDTQYGNIAAAVRHYREAIVNLETVNPKPDFYDTLVEDLTEAQAELDERYRNQNFNCDQAIRLEDWPLARSELQILCEMLDEQDSRRADASARLLDVENRMKRK